MSAIFIFLPPTLTSHSFAALELGWWILACLKAPSLTIHCWNKHVKDQSKLTALAKQVFDTCGHYWVDHKAKLFWSWLIIDGAAINFPKSGQNKKWKKNFTVKKLSLPLTSGVEIFFGFTIFHFWIISHQIFHNVYY